MDGVPRSLPAVMEAYQLTRRASRVGFDWENAGAVLEKLHEESAELNDEIGRDPGDLEEEAGDLLFAAVNVARFLKIDPEIALKKANRKFERRFRMMEEVAAKSGKKMGEVSAAEMDVIWEAIKRHEKTRARGHDLPGARAGAAEDSKAKTSATKSKSGE
jgi:MazG family protein